MRFAAILVLALPLLGADAPPQKNTKHEAALELVELMKTSKMFTDMLDEYRKAAGKQMEANLLAENEDKTKLTEEQKTSLADFDREFSRFQTVLFTKLDLKDFEAKVLVPLYLRYFTETEIREMTAFYRTKTGKKTLEALPKLMAESERVSAEYLGPIIAEVQSQIQKEDEEREPWRRTMSDMRTLATAIEAFAVDEEALPQVTSLDELEALLAPTYVRTMPRTDVWGEPYSYVVSEDGMSYRIVSAGSDRVFDWDSRRFRAPNEVARKNSSMTLAADLIFENGEFIQWPREADDE